MIDLQVYAGLVPKGSNSQPKGNSHIIWFVELFVVHYVNFALLFYCWTETSFVPKHSGQNGKSGEIDIKKFVRPIKPIIVG